MHTIEQVEELRTKARAHVHDMVQLAYDAGRQRGDVPGDAMKPSAKAVNGAVDHVELAAVKLAHARMEETAKRCGFEGLTEALGYLITLRDNPVAELLREAVNLAALGDIDESTEAYGWGHWFKRAKAVVGDTAPPPEAISVDAHELAIERRPEVEVHTATGEALDRKLGMRPELAADFGPSAGAWPQMAGRFQRPEQQVLSGCAVRAAIQVEEAADPWDFYGLPRTRLIAGAPIYYWDGRGGRASRVPSWCARPVGSEHVVIDETRGDPAGPAPVCRIVESIEPLSLGHTLCISREELQPLAEGSWVPKGGATTS
jgi:hypothetical protein